MVLAGRARCFGQGAECSGVYLWVQGGSLCSDNYRVRCYCQGDGCSRAQLDGLFGVMVGQKEGILPGGWIAAAEKKA